VQWPNVTGDRPPSSVTSTTIRRDSGNGRTVGHIASNVEGRGRSDLYHVTADGSQFPHVPRTSIFSREEPDIVCISRGVVHVTTGPPELGKPAEAKYSAQADGLGGPTGGSA
jgi:hypothetical protein